MKTPPLVALSGLVLTSALLIGARNVAVSAAAPAQNPPALGHLDLDCGADPCDAIARGAHAFADHRLQGLDSNGRSCSDCHQLTDHFQLAPADVEDRFEQLQQFRQVNRHADDPLFRPIDADDFRVNGEDATDFSNLRENGLVRITFPLPPNIKLIDPQTNAPSAEWFVDVWRMVPTVNDVALTGPDGLNAWARGPNNTGGYQLDARVATLQEQALGALTNHAGVRNQVPEGLLDDLAAFQRVQFTNERVAALAGAVAAGATTLPDPDPPLDALEHQGKAVFVRACTQCHGGPGLSTAQPPVGRYHDIATQCPRPVDAVSPARFAYAVCPPRLARNARSYEITLANGTKTRRTSSDPGRALLTGFVGGPAPLDDWNKFDVPALRGISHTAPYFHNNSAATLEEVVDHYTEFFKRVKINTAPAVPPVLSTDGVHFDRPAAPEERAALLAYLRKL